MASADRLAFLWRFSAYAIDPMRMADFATAASVMPVCATPMALKAAAAANVGTSHPPRHHEGRDRSLVQPPFPRTDRIRTNHHDSGMAAFNLDEPDVAALGRQRIRQRIAEDIQDRLCNATAPGQLHSSGVYVVMLRFEHLLAGTHFDPLRGEGDAIVRAPRKRHE